VQEHLSSLRQQVFNLDLVPVMQATAGTDQFLIDFAAFELALHSQAVFHAQVQFDLALRRGQLRRLEPMNSSPVKRFAAPGSKVYWLALFTFARR
jgi:hypothetical protein